MHYGNINSLILRARAQRQDIMPDIPQLDESQQAGQRLMVGFDGPSLDDRLKYYIDGLKVGGIILFARNLEEPRQMEKLCADAQDYARQCGQPPLFIGIDQEGGVVSRLKPPFTQFAGNPSIRTRDDAVNFARITARELAQIGVNMNMAPVLDVLPEQGDSVMAERAFGHDPHFVSQLGTAVIDIFQQNRILAVAKHFPGIGRTVLDSHLEMPDLDTALEQLETRDIIPFRSAIDSGVSGIMLSHIRYRSLDHQWPASLSVHIADKLLRRRYGYQGLVLTDDLDMGAIAGHYPLDKIVSQCLSGAVDILLICHPSEKIQSAHGHIIDLQNKNEAWNRKTAAALDRILKMKTTFLISD
jgi:beta-N-acetylhexosaminidase